MTTLFILLLIYHFSILFQRLTQVIVKIDVKCYNIQQKKEMARYG